MSFFSQSRKRIPARRSERLLPYQREGQPTPPSSCVLFSCSSALASVCTCCISARVAILKRQQAHTILSKPINWITVVGINSSNKALRIPSKSPCSSSATNNSFENKPCRNALTLELFLPRRVLGPVLFVELLRF